MAVEFQLERLLSVRYAPQRGKWNSEIAVTNCADTLDGNLSDPLSDPQQAFAHMSQNDLRRQSKLCNMAGSLLQDY